MNSDLLLRDGVRVRIQELPLRLLLILLENPGTVISNQELGRRLGGSGWYVELGSVRVAVTKLREALGDSASAPSFIRTIPGQGYKFIAPVTPISDEGVIRASPADTVTSRDEAAAAPVEATPDPVKPDLDGPVAKSRPAGRSIPFPVRAGQRIMRALAALGVDSPYRLRFAAACIVALGGMTAWYFHRQSVRPVAAEHDVVVVGGFTNHSQNRALDGTLSSAFFVKMQESPYLNLLTDKKFRELIPNPEVATLKDELHACRTLNGRVLLVGQLTGTGAGQEIELAAWGCQTSHRLARETADVRSEAEILPALNRVAEQMRERLGEPENSVQRFNVPVEQATTSSLAALRAFTQGEEKHQRGLEEEAVRDYRFTVDLDPQFALAYARLGTIYYNSGEYALSRQNYEKAFELRSRTTDRERLYITANYYMCNTGEIQRAIEAYEFWRKIYPKDLAPVNNLAIQYLLAGEPQKAVELAHVGMTMTPNSNISYATWSEAFLQTGDYSTLNTLCDAQSAKNESAVFHVHCFDGAFAQGDEARMNRELAWGKGQPEENLLLTEAAMVALYRGQTTKAWQLFRAARMRAEQRNMPEAAAGAALNMAGFQSDLGLRQQAAATVTDALKHANESALLMGFGALAMARAGEIQRAQQIALQASRLAPHDEILNHSILASTRAAMELAQHRPEAAVGDLEESKPLDSNNFMELAPIYYRGIAYLANGQLSEAIAEFNTLISRRPLFPCSPYLVLAELQRGRALQLAGDSAGAAASFAKLDSLWRDADADFAPLRDLRAYEHGSASRVAGNAR